MNPDDRLHRHLTAQAGTIELTPADPDTAKRRGMRRRNRRRAALVGVTAVALVATTVTVIEPGGDDKSTVDMDAAASVGASTYDWTAIDPLSGLGYGSPQVELDGSIYSLSTAPGDRGDGESQGRRLYRSADGAEWVTVDLPAGLAASSLAAADGTLYAIGTAPAGGDARDLVVAASTDGAATWTQLPLPAEVAELDARFPGQISISQPTIASLDATHLVATVGVTSRPDVEALVPEGTDTSGGWTTTPEGVTTYGVEACTEADAARCGVQPPTTIAPDGDEDPAAGTDLAQRELEAERRAEPKETGTFTWDELGLDPALQELVTGRTYVYASVDGTTFEPVTLPDGGDGGYTQVVATADGYSLFVSTWDGSQASARVLQSVDGLSWSPAGNLPGAVQAGGVLAGRPAVSLYTEDGGPLVQVQRDDGGWGTVDLLAAVEPDGTELTVYDVAFGPLGLAAVIGTLEEDPAVHVVHSADGANLSVVAVDDVLAEAGGLLGIHVGSDAINVRFSGPNDGDPATPPTNRVLVGTPAG